MIRSARWLLALLSSAFLCSAARTQTINAASCNLTDVAAALAGITTDGTTVVIPAGTCTWTTTLSYTQTHSFTLQGTGAVSGTGLISSIGGVGTDLTTIIDGKDVAGNYSGVLVITTLAGKSFRLTGIAWGWAGTQTVAQYNGIVNVSGGSTSVRIDHNHFLHLGGKDILLVGGVLGVIDHNQFDGGSPLLSEFHLGVYMGGLYNDSSNIGNVSWTIPGDFGSANYLFVENNNFEVVPIGGTTQRAFVYDCSYGGRVVFRFNALGYHELWQTHGTGSQGDIRGCRAFENYENVNIFTTAAQAAGGNDIPGTLYQMESGTGMIWGNTITYYGSIVQADVVRTNKLTYSQNPTPNGWGFCGTTYGPSNWDGNQDSKGYPCVDGIGRGAGDLLSGVFPTKCNQTLGCSTYSGQSPRQALEPTYVFNNVYNPPANYPDHYWTNTAPVSIAENRDYYLEIPNYGEPGTFNGTTGVGCGPAGSSACNNAVNRPSTCTTGVGFWDTSQGNWNQSGSGPQGVFYACTATNTWTLYYTPYTYPHPLATGTPAAIPPSAPNAQVH